MKPKLASFSLLFLIIWVLALALPAAAQNSWRTLSDSRAHNAIWMTSATHGWIVGDYGLIRRTTDGGTTWSLQDSGTTARLNGIWGTDENNVWAVGDGGAILYWDGTEWFDHSLATMKEDLYAIDGSGFDNVMAVGFEGVVMRWDGTDWTESHPAVASGTHLRGVRAISATSAWVIGDLGLIMRLTNTTWSDQSLAQLNNYRCITPSSRPAFIGGSNGSVLKASGSTWVSSGNTGTTQTIRSLFALDATHVWAVAESGVIRFYNGTTWTAQSTGIGTESLYAITAITDTKLILVGDRGMIGRKTGSAAWSIETQPAPAQHLYAAWARSSDEVWMVGAQGTAIFYHNASLLSTRTDVFEDLHGLWGLPNGKVWAVGNAGTVIQWDGTQWTEQASGVTENLRGVWASSETSAWAVGEGGTIIRWDGLLWTKVASGTTANLNAVWGANAGDVWAVGAGGTVRYFNGASWASQASGTTAELFDVHGVSSAAVWAVGAGGVITRFHVSAWARQVSGTTETLHGITGLPGNLWAVGARALRKLTGAGWSDGGSNLAATSLLDIAGSNALGMIAVGSSGTIFTTRPDPSPEIAVEQPVGTDLLSDGVAVDFGRLKVAELQSQTLTFTLKNFGNADLDDLAFTLKGTDIDDFVLDAPVETLLAPAASTTFTITFTPSHDGLHSAALEIASTDLDESPFILNLTGDGLVPASVVASPQDVSIDPGKPVTLSVTVEGSAPFTYQWRKDGEPIAGATARTYTITSADESDEGSYDCVINNPEGTEVISDAATLSVNDPVEITAQPEAFATSAGASHVFTVTATGSEPISYQWKRNGTNIPGATSSSLSLSNIALGQAGTYTVVVSNSVNTDTSTSALLTIVEASPRLICLPVGAASTAITITASSPVSSYTWGKDGGPLPNDYRYTGWAGRTLSLRNLRSTDSGSITCAVAVGSNIVTTTTAIIIYSAVPQVTHSGAMPFGMVGAEYRFTIPVTPGNDRKPLSYGATGLPPGLRINTATGSITGKPLLALTSDKVFPVTLSATNAFGTSKVSTSLLIKALLPGGVGTFTGPISRDPVINANLGGCLALTVASNGSLTGKVQLGATIHSVTGSLIADATGALPTQGNIVIRRAAPLEALSITFDLDPATHQLTNGDISDGTEHASFTAWRSRWGTVMPAGEASALRSLIGYYTFGLQPGASAPTDGSVPEGLGFGSFTIASTGLLTIAGRLADGTAYTTATFCGPEGQVLLYQPLYSNGGSILGQLTITPGSPSSVPAFADSTLSGTASWMRPAMANNRAYADGFEPFDLDIAGGRYIVPKSPQIIMGLTDAPTAGSSNASLTFGPASITTQVMPDISLRIRSTAAIFLPLPADNERSTTLSIKIATGHIGGSFTLEDPNPSAPGSNAIRPCTFSGIITQDGSGAKGIGHFLLPELPAPASSDTVLTTKILSGPVLLQAE